MNVEYKVTSSTGLTVADVSYGNDTGGTSNEDDAPLPWSKKFKRTVKQYDHLSISVTGNGGSLATEVLVDGQRVAGETYSGTSTIVGSTVHLFP